MNTALSFTERLCHAYDFNRGCPPADGAERAARDDIVEYIDAFSIDKSPDHPTSAIAWDLQRTLGESEGRRMLLYASRRWDATPLRARDVVKMWWDDDHEPEAWRDEYLLDLIQGWRMERDRLQTCADAEKEWRAFNGSATKQQILAWRVKFGSWYLSPERTLGPVTIIPFPAPPSAPIAKPTAPAIRSAASLKQKTFSPVHYVVPGYLAEGCTILAGRPKVGKSWFMLDVGLAVASGGQVLGTKAEQGDVLYLGLEDNERRLKSRIGKVIGPFVDWPERFQYATEWPRADEGGLEQIKAWLKSVALPRLIVVDVLARFRSPHGRSTAQYDADYSAIQGLQAIASEARVALVIVHHLRKSAADSDPFDKVSGTLGLSGAADTVLILDRDGQGTVLYGRGRDIEEIETAVKFNPVKCRWEVLGSAQDVRQSGERKAIVTALSEAGIPMSPADIAKAVHRDRNGVDQLLFKMVRDGELEKNGRGSYALPTHKIDKIVSIGQHITLPPLPPPR